MTLFRKSDEGGDTSESNDGDQLSTTDAASMACASDEDPPAMVKDDQDDSDYQSVRHETSARAASTGEKAPTT